MASLKYFKKNLTQQKQRGLYIANENGGPLDVTTWVLYRENLTDVPNRYVGKKVYVLADDEVFYFNGSVWNQLTNTHIANSTTYKKGSLNVSSKFKLKFYKVGQTMQEQEEDKDDGSDEKIIVANSYPNEYKEWSEIESQGGIVKKNDVIKIGSFYFKAKRDTINPPLSKYLVRENGSDFYAKSFENGFLFAEKSDNYIDYEPLSTVIRASLILPVKIEGVNDVVNIEYPKNGYTGMGNEDSGKFKYRLTYKWYVGSFDNDPLSVDEYSECLDWMNVRRFSIANLNEKFSDKICCEIYIQMEGDSKRQLIARNSVKIVSESYINTFETEDVSRGLVYMSPKVSQYQRGFLNSLIDSSRNGGIDTTSVVKTMNYKDYKGFPKYFGKTVYSNDDDKLHIYKHHDRVVYCKNTDSDDSRIIHYNSNGSGQWKEFNAVPVRFDNFSKMGIRIETVPTDVSVDIDTSIGAFKKMSFDAFLDFSVNEDISSKKLSFTLQDLKDKKYSYDPIGLEFYGLDTKVEWTVSQKETHGENYHDLVPGDASSLDPNNGLILPSKESNVVDYYGNPIISNPHSFHFEFGVTNDVYDTETYSVKCEMTINGEYNRPFKISKEFSFNLERRSYIDFNTIKATEITPLVGKFSVSGERVDFKDGQDIHTDASSFYALDNTIGLRYKVYYTLGELSRSKNQWGVMDEDFIEFVQTDVHSFEFRRKSNKSLPQSIKDLGVIDNGKLPFGIYRIVPFLGDTMFNLKYDKINGIKDYDFYQNISLFTLQTTEIGNDGSDVPSIDFGREVGEWYNGLRVNYGEIVTMRGEQFVCINKNGSSFAPLERFTTLGSEALTYSKSLGEGYVLTGDINPDYAFAKTSIKPGYFSAENTIIKVNPDIKTWEDVVYPKPMNLGGWRDGLRVRYNDLVSMGGVTFQCINPNGTTNPPMYRFTTNGGRYLTLNDNGFDVYVLTGELNTKDYISALSVTDTPTIPDGYDASSFYVGDQYKGVWKNGMHLDYKDTVLMRGVLYQCEKLYGTDECPLERVILTTSDGNFNALYNDGDAVLWSNKVNEGFRVVDTRYITSFEPVEIPFGTIVEYKGSYYKCVNQNGTIERPFKLLTDSTGNKMQYLSGDFVLYNEMNNKEWSLDKNERFVIDDRSKLNPKRLVIWGHIRGNYIDLSQLVLSSNVSRTLRFEVIDSPLTVRMSQDSDYYSSVEYKVVFNDNPNIDWEKEIARITYATKNNPLNNKSEIEKECFVFHPYLVPQILETTSGWHKNDGSEVYIAGTNNYQVKGTPIGKYLDEKGNEIEIKSDVKFYCGDNEFIPNVTNPYPNLEFGRTLESRLILDAEGLYDTSLNFIGNQMPMPIIRLEGEMIFNDENKKGRTPDGREYIFAYTNYPLDVSVSQIYKSDENDRFGQICTEKIDKTEYSIEIYTKENDCYVFGDNIKNKKYKLVGYDEVEIMFKDQDQEIIDLYMDITIFGGYKFTIEKMIQIYNKIVPIDVKVIKSVEINLNGENRIVGQSYMLPELIDNIVLTFDDNSVKVYEGSQFGRLVDSGRIRFENPKNATLVNGLMTITGTNPSVDIRFSGWDDSKVIKSLTGVTMNCVPEITYFGFKDINVYSNSAKSFDITEDMDIFGSDEYKLNLYIKGKNLKYLFNSDIADTMNVGLKYSCTLSGMSKLNWSQEFIDVEINSEDISLINSNEENIFPCGRISLHDMIDNQNRPLSKDFIGYQFEDLDKRKKYGFAQIKPILSILYKGGDEFVFESDSDGTDAKLCAVIMWHVMAETNNTEYGSVDVRDTDDNYTEYFSNGTTAILNAVPNTGYSFKRWYEDEDGELITKSISSEFIENIYGNKKFVAKFLPNDMNEYFIDVQSANPTAGSVELWVGGRKTSERYFDTGTSYELRAIPANGYTFSVWDIEEDIVEEFDAPVGLNRHWTSSDQNDAEILNGNVVAVARFESLKKVSLYNYVNYVRIDDKSGLSGSGSYEKGTEVSIDASSMNGEKSFDGWYTVDSSGNLGDKISSVEKFNVAIQSDLVYGANYMQEVSILPVNIDLEMGNLGNAEIDSNFDSYFKNQRVYGLGFSEDRTTHNKQISDRIRFYNYYDEVSFDLMINVSSELNYDFFIVGKVDTDYSISDIRTETNVLKRISGTDSYFGTNKCKFEKFDKISITLNTRGNHYINIFYATDVSVVRGKDKGWYYITNIKKKGPRIK